MEKAEIVRLLNEKLGDSEKMETINDFNCIPAVPFDELPEWNLVTFRPDNSWWFTEVVGNIRRIFFVLHSYLDPEVGPSPWPSVVIQRGRALVPEFDIISRTGEKTVRNEALIMKAASVAFRTLSNTKPIEAPVVDDSLTKYQQELERKKSGVGKKYKTKMALNKKGACQVVLTPRVFVEYLHGFFNFDHDPCPLHSEMDAMVAPWGRRNYCNPPFRHADAFLLRALSLAESEGVRTVMLIPARTKTVWFNNLIRHKMCRSIVFLRHGLRFQGYRNAFPSSLMLVIIGPGSVPLKMLFWDPLETLGTMRVQPSTNQTFMDCWEDIEWDRFEGELPPLSICSVDYTEYMERQGVLDGLNKL